MVRILPKPFWDVYDFDDMSVFDIATIVMELYVGYRNGTGSHFGTLEKILKFGPVVTAVSLTALGTTITYLRYKHNYHSSKEGLDSKEINESSYLLDNTLGRIYTLENVIKKTFYIGLSVGIESAASYYTAYGVGFIVNKMVHFFKGLF